MNTYTLITGGSDGIGLELAKLFAKDKHNLVLVARNIEKLNKAKQILKCQGVDVKIISMDLSSMEECQRLIDYIEDRNILVDTLVNNAGIGSFGEFKNISWEKEEALIDINIKALSKLTKHFLPKIIKLKQGGILNVASTAAFCSGPKMATYYASKAYVLNLTEAIHEEVRNYGIKVSCLCPGPVKTAFQMKSGIEKSEGAKKYLMEAEDVAKEGYKGFKKGKVIIVAGVKNKFLVKINKFAPRSIVRKIVLKTNGK
ncbi:MAG: SDR family oxidoreductase [Clostridium sp.]|nr:SDR family oxidoreductase [Clostridium sp.]